MTPTAPLLALSCQACDISGKERTASLHSGDLSEGPEPLDQLSSPGGTTSGEEKTGSSLHPPPHLGGQPCLWPQLCFPKREYPGRLQFEERQRRQSQREVSQSREGLLSLGSAPPSRGGGQWEAPPPLLTLSWHFFL